MTSSSLEMTVKNTILFYLKLAITIGLVVYLVNSVGLVKFSSTIKQGIVSNFLYAAALSPVFILIKSYKWHLMVRRAAAQEGFAVSLNAVVAGLGFGVFTPARAGEIMRVKYYKSVEKVMLGGLVIVDRLIDLITILILCLYFALLKLGPVWVGVFVLMNCSIIVALVQVKNSSKILLLFPLKMRSGKIQLFLEKIETVSAVLTLRNAAQFGGLSFLNWFFVIVQFYLTINMFHICTVNAAFAGLPIIQLSNLVPITIAGIGVRENLSVFVMRSFDIPDEVAAIGAFSLYVLNIFIPGMAGLLLYSLRSKGRQLS